MQTQNISIKSSLNKAYLKLPPTRSQIDKFKSNSITLFNRIKETEGEEFHKNEISEFLKSTYYSPNHYINTHGRFDLVIHIGKGSSSHIGVLVECKSPGNQTEMPTINNLNVKAIHELVLYFLEERITNNNLEIKHLVVTNLYEWFIFDAHVFEACFSNNKALIKQFQDFKEGRLTGKDTSFFYNSIASPFLDNLDKQFEFTHFDLRDYKHLITNSNPEDDNLLIPIFKILSPEHLLKLQFKNDSNSLDKDFYHELLHIIGLEETKNSSKKIIGRATIVNRNYGSLLESAISVLQAEDLLSQIQRPSDYGYSKDEQLFNIALELVITWINRILFLKLLEGQLVKYNQGDETFKFLNQPFISDYDALNKLFFYVLAVPIESREERLKDKFKNIPYLNSSLFEATDLERITIRISNLDDSNKLPVFKATVLKDHTGKRITGDKPTIHYLFEFLESYDFSSEGGREIQEENKTLINASVLGLIFEKINGYKDGSFFTPGYITQYMCHEAIVRAVVQKFNVRYGWTCQSLTEIHNKIEDKLEANRLINHLKICDPAVGSGHFLVSALNEILAIKSDLKILMDREGKVLRDYKFEVVNDELIVSDPDGEPFEYKSRNHESQRVQEAIFHEKQTIIENSLFGVDINPNSVKICRLRLWIELLKHTYYKLNTQPPELETLPNIDINIKCGNSLISRYPLDADIKEALKSSKWTVDNYREAVMTYRNAETKEQKRAMEKLISEIKNNFETEITKNDKRFLRLNRIKGELLSLTSQQGLFKLDKEQKDKWLKQLKKLTNEQALLEIQLNEIKDNKIYRDAFEWRFEFPEVLDFDGSYEGFDITLGNPPYIRQEEVKHLSAFLQTNYKCFSGKADIFTFFYELNIRLTKPNGYVSLITSNKFLEAGYGKVLLDFLLDNTIIYRMLNFNDLPVFEGVSAYPMILLCQKANINNYEFEYFNFKNNLVSDLKVMVNNSNRILNSKKHFRTNHYRIIHESEADILSKLRVDTISLNEFCGLPLVGIKTGLNGAFLTDSSSSQYIKPYLFGRDLKRFEKPSPRHYLIFPYESNGTLIDIDENSIIRQLLLPSKTMLSNRAIIKDGLDSGNKKWYEFQQINKSIDFENEYIVYPNVSLGPNFTLSSGAAIDMTCFIINSNNKYLLAILNSRLVDYLMNLYGIKRRGGYVEYKVQYLKHIPVKNIPEPAQLPYILLVDKIIKEKQLGNITVQFEHELDQMIFDLYGLTEKEKHIIEEHTNTKS